MEPSNSESERYAELSRQYIERADGYLRAGDRVQASEKGWGAVAEAMKSIAEQRGWNHQGHRLLNDIAFQLSEEWRRPDVRILFDAMEKLHINFYEDNMGLDAIAASVGDAKTLLGRTSKRCASSSPARSNVGQPGAASALAASHRRTAAAGCGDQRIRLTDAMRGRQDSYGTIEFRIRKIRGTEPPVHPKSRRIPSSRRPGAGIGKGLGRGSRGHQVHRRAARLEPHEPAAAERHSPFSYPRSGPAPT